MIPLPEILVVEDERIIALDLCSMLQRLGYHVSAFVDSGIEAIEQARQQRPDLILMDIRLRDDIDGVEAAAAILREQEVPIIYLTAHADEQTRQRVRTTAPYGYLVKPFDAIMLQTTIETALERFRLDQQLARLRALERAQEAERRHEAEVAQHQRLRVFAGGIAHDLNNLLTSVGGYATLLRDAGLPPASTELIDNLLAGVEQAAQLSQNLLAYAGKLPVQRRPVDLLSLVAEVAALLGRSALQGKRLHLPPREPELLVEGDAAQLRQVLMNLLINAAEAIGAAGGAIRVDCVPCEREQIPREVATPALAPGHYAALSVSDDGCGMDEATRARVFEPFFTTKFQGRGLGLASVQGIVQEHRGAVVIRSEPGRGSTVTVYLPLAREARRAHRPSAQVIASTIRLAGHQAARDCAKGLGTILVVDDEEQVRRVVCRMLAHIGWATISAADAQEALDAVERHGEISYALLDFVLPGMNGVELARQIKMLRPKLGLALMSGYIDPEALSEQMVEFGAVLRKPFSMRELRLGLAQLSAHFEQICADCRAPC